MVAEIYRYTLPNEVKDDDPGGELVRCAFHVETCPSGKWILSAMGDSLSLAIRLAQTGDWPTARKRRVTYGGNVMWETHS